MAVEHRIPHLVNAVGVVATLERALAAAVVVDPETLRLVVVCLLARGHALLEDVPGVGKTLLARTLAGALGGAFHRIQFTPDLLPADITGGSIYDPSNGEFTFRPGPVFGNGVLADELNRGTPRAQSSLLEAMGEGHVSADGLTHELPDPFFVIATQNPMEQHGTFPLPESELDRFTMLLHLGRLDMDQTREVLRRHEHREPPRHQPAVVDIDSVRAAQDEVIAVTASEAARDYIAALALATRNHPQVALPASVRGTVAMLRAAQANAACDGRGAVLADDVKRVAPFVLGHRLGLVGANADDIVHEIVAGVPIPGLP